MRKNPSRPLPPSPPGRTPAAVVVFAVAAVGPATALAHPGHGAQVPWHAHSSDAWGFAVVALLAAVLAIARRK